jgi:monoamine oxidase
MDGSGQLFRAGRPVLTRRRFLQVLGATAGSAAVANAMAAWGHLGVSAQTEPPKLTGKVNGVKVVVLGAGPGGCPSAYELMNLGYDVTVLEAHSHVGGHAFTVRRGAKTHEYGGEEQVCNFDADPTNWFDAGPSRLPSYHRAILHYCKVFNIPMIDYNNINLNAWTYAEGIDGAMSGKKMRLGELQADMGGYTSELLAKAANQDTLDGELTADDRDQLVEYLTAWGMLSSKDLAYTSDTSNRGFSQLPGAGDRPGVPSDPVPFKDLLPFANAVVGGESGYLAAVASYDWWATLLQPVNGMEAIYSDGFHKALGDRIKLNSEVTEIRQSDNDVTITYKNTESGETQQIKADYCMCNIPLSVLMKIPSDFSSKMRAAMEGIAYATAMRMGMQFKRRFWEEDDWIYGGQSFFNNSKVGILGYPNSDYMASKGVLLALYNFGNDAINISRLSLKDREEFGLQWGSKIHPTYRQDFESSFSVAWHRMPYSLGAWPSFTTRTRQQYYPTLLEPDGRIYLVGEHLSYVNAWQEGAYQAAWVQVPKLHERVMQTQNNA